MVVKKSSVTKAASMRRMQITASVWLQASLFYFATASTNVSSDFLKCKINVYKFTHNQ